ncbi:MAG: Wzz/FepE/Etk N-terminal domain-containing protein, partial [Bacteroidota bacterium]|nr:Wzz/FepE/Etk N-terminal domain-containing protein [Bacteroidota bacterium]
MEGYNDEIQLKDILIKLSEYKVFLFKKKVAIIAFSFLFFLIGFVFAFTLNTKYNAELTFVVQAEQGSGSLGSMAGLASQFGFDIGSGGENSTFSQSNVIELLKSRGVIQNTLMQNAKVNSTNDLLIEHYFEINDLKGDLVKSNDFKGVSFHDNINYIQDSLSGIIWLTIIADHLTVEMQ